MFHFCIQTNWIKVTLFTTVNKQLLLIVQIKQEMFDKVHIQKGCIIY